MCISIEGFFHYFRIPLFFEQEQGKGFRIKLQNKNGFMSMSVLSQEVV